VEKRLPRGGAVNLPIWGQEFNKLRDEAYKAPTPSRLRNYTMARGMGFCESCGSPNACEVVSVAPENNPRSYIAVCPSCQDMTDNRLKVEWIEDHLADGKLLYVTAAVIFNSKGEVLVCQRSNSLWEFPGGKIDEGEDLITCLQREINEELAINLINITPFLLVDHDYGRVKLRLFSFRALLNTPAEEIHLNDHVAFEFMPLTALPLVELSQADIYIAQKLVEQ